MLRDECIMILYTPISDEEINKLSVGDMIEISGDILCGRDAVLPKVVHTDDNCIVDLLKGSVIFHTAVSKAGLGPTSSNKIEIESSIIPLSQMGVKIHMGKGRISDNTIKEMEKYNSVYAIIPPVTALLSENTLSSEIIAYEELGMEAFYRVKVKSYPIIIAAAHGQSIYDK